MNKIYKSECTPKYPVYIISKGRWESRLTSKAFEKLNVPYYIVIEKSEYEKYSEVISPEKILILDETYKDRYDPCDDLGSTMSKGSGPARNFVWDHSISIGAKWHWIFDDNIIDFYFINNNRKIRVADGTIFKLMEDFCDLYENIAMAGPNYQWFIVSTCKYPPYFKNTRIYSMILIRNDIPYRWRCRFNEDTDLSLRVLKDKWCTIQFNMFLGDKATTQSMTGGNTEELYGKGTLAKSKMLVNLHPDVARLVWRYNRWHHDVNYNLVGAQRLIRKSNVTPKKQNQLMLIEKSKLNQTQD